MDILTFLLIALIITSVQSREKKKFHFEYLNSNRLYNWKQVEFSIPSEQGIRKSEAKERLELYTPNIIDVQPHYDDNNLLRTFLTISRFFDGVPYTLAKVSNKTGAYGHILEPYPNIQVHMSKNGTDCNAIISAFRMMINECNQMWVIDSGSLNLHSLCPPKLLLIDLTTDKIIYRYRFNESLYTPGVSIFDSILVNVEKTDSRNNCSHTMVYVADVQSHGLVVYDYMKKTAWRIENRFMYPDPNCGLISVNGNSFVLMHGIIGLATDKRKLYFHALASKTEYAVPLRVINNSTLFKNNIANNDQSFKSVFQRRSHCAASAMDSHKNLYCVTLDPMQLTVWHADLGYEEHVMDAKVLQIVSGMKIVKDRTGGEEIWMLSNFCKKNTECTQYHKSIVMRYRIGFVPYN